jgi:pentatricopeptide repeat protein
MTISHFLYRCSPLKRTRQIRNYNSFTEKLQSDKSNITRLHSNTIVEKVRKTPEFEKGNDQYRKYQARVNYWKKKSDWKQGLRVWREMRKNEIMPDPGDKQKF